VVFPLILFPRGWAHAGSTEIISSTKHDIDRDSTVERIEIVLDSGRKYDDSERWCGNGEKWEGIFSIRVLRGEDIISSQNLNALFHGGAAKDESLFFWTPRFPLVMRDYNGDGRPDFNLGQYGSCNVTFFKLFTVGPDGVVARLPVKGEEDGIPFSPPERTLSTRHLSFFGGAVQTLHYDNSRGKTIYRKYRWNENWFELANETALLREAFGVRETTPNRTLPHAFHDQAVSSIKGIYPEGEIIEAERGGKAFNSYYAFVAFKEKKGSKVVHLDCMATDYRKAYHLGITIHEKDMDRAGSALLERLSDLFSTGDGSSRSVEWLRGNCLPLKDRYIDSPDKTVECRVNRFGALVSIGGTRYHFCLYRWLIRFGEDAAGAGDIYDKFPYNSTAVVILGMPEDGRQPRPLFSFHNEGMIGVSWFEEPKVIENEYGKILVIPERLSGTGAGTNDRFLIWMRGRWQKIDSGSWRKDLAAKLPEGHGVWKGIHVDIKTMKFQSPLWRDGDANCCPTGGKVLVDLTLKDRRFEIREFRLVPP
jgi:hypothetical protein